MNYRSQDSLVRVLRARGIAALLFTETPDPLDLDPDVWTGFAGVYCGAHPGVRCPFPVARYNAFDAAVITYRKIEESGYRRIGLILGHHANQLSSLDQKTLAGFQLMQQEAPRRNRVPTLVESIPKLLAKKSLIEAWFEKHRPDAVAINFAALKFKLEQVTHLPFAATRVGQNYGNTIAGCLVNRDHVEWEALCCLESRIRTAYAGRRQGLALVIDPQWQTGESLWSVE